MDAQYATGMIAGAIGLICYGALAALLVKRLKAMTGTILAWVAWVIPAGVVYWVFLR